MRLAELAQRRVAILGRGRETRALLAVFAAQVPDCRYTVFDEQGEAHAQAEVGAFDGARLSGFDLIIRSPGVPLLHPALRRPAADGVPIITSSSIWFSERPDACVVAVTGSKGKSTTSALLAHLLSGAGRSTVLAGNIGVPLIGHLQTRADVFVVELSSYQLADLGARPRLGVMTRLFPEHQDWHGGVAAYYQAKLRLMTLLDGAPLVINAADRQLADATAGYAARIAANHGDGLHGREEGLFDGGRCLRAAHQLPLRGRHNAGNIAVALCAAEALGAARAALLPALDSFQPLPHRLQPVDGGGRWINDSIASAPPATLAALQVFPVSPVVLLAGGQERGTDWSAVFDWCRQHPLRALITLPDNGARIAAQARAAGIPAHSVHDSLVLDQAVALAARLAGDDAVVLFSPGAPSFPHFRDFEARGRAFSELALGYVVRRTE